MVTAGMRTIVAVIISKASVDTLGDDEFSVVASNAGSVGVVVGKGDEDGARMVGTGN